MSKITEIYLFQNLILIVKPKLQLYAKKQFRKCIDVFATLDRLTTDRVAVVVPEPYFHSGIFLKPLRHRIASVDVQ